MNKLTLAVAGGRKTQSIVDECQAAPADRRILVLTYTQHNQQELNQRLNQLRPLAAEVTVRGWFSFLMGDWVRPYLPRLFQGKRLRGLNFDGDPGIYVTGASRFLDSQNRCYKLHLAKLAVDVKTASNGAVLNRLSRIYDTIYIDEVQDLNGYDLDVIEALLQSPINLNLVGDIRQALLMTNVRDPRNKQYKGTAILKWFEQQVNQGTLEIEHQATTWRCNQPLASFADTIFSSSWGFPPTSSQNLSTSDHDGVFAVATEHVDAYVTKFNPLCLRHNINSARSLDLEFMNIALAKGMGVERVLIGPTAAIVEFLRSGAVLHETAACELYVAVTRARASVAFVHDNPATLRLPIWIP